jgi:transcriptional regulator with XRE-family HTH domain
LNPRAAKSLEVRVLTNRFAKRLALSLQRTGKSAADLARESQTSPSLLSSYLSGQPAGLPNGRTLWRLASALGVSVDFLLGCADLRADTCTRPCTDLVPATPRGEHEAFEGLVRRDACVPVTYFPETLPWFLKTRAFLVAEGHCPEVVTDGHVSAAARMASHPPRGVILIRREVLIAVISLKGSYATLPRHAAMQMIEDLRAFGQRHTGRCRLRAVDVPDARAYPVLICEPDVVIHRFCDQYLRVRNQVVHDRAADCLRELSQTSPDLDEWFARHMPSGR